MQVPYNKSETLQSAVAATGNGTTMEVGDLCSVGFQVSGTFSATVTFEGNVDLTNWVSIQVSNIANGTVSTTATAAGVYVANVAGLRQVRARVTWTSGTSVTVKAFGTAAVAADRAGTSAALGTGPTVDSYNCVVVDCAAGATTDLVAAPGAGKQLWVYKLFGTADTAAGTVRLHDNTPTNISGTMAVSDEGGWVLNSDNLAMPWGKCATNTALQLTTVSCTFDGMLCYAVVSV